MLRLDGAARFRHFVKSVADWEVAWGLWQEGWALMGDSKEEQVFPLWPAREYAAACQTDEWIDYEPKEISLSDLLDEVLPRLKSEGFRLGVFPTPEGKGVTVTVDELDQALREEMERYK